LRVIDEIFAFVESVVLRKKQCFVGLHENLLLFTLNQLIDAFGLSFFGAMRRIIIGAPVEHPIVVLEVRVHPLVIDISASFFLEDVVALKVDLDETLIFEGPGFDQLLEYFDIV
jgi:hypothetical protein